MSKLLSFFAFVLFFQTATAQFPGGGGGGFGGSRSQQMPGMNPKPQEMPDEPVRGNSRISGNIVDSLSAKPVEYANVALFDKKTNKLIDGAVADEKGKFIIKNLAAGEYKVSVTFLGYKTASKDITLDKKGAGSDINIGNLSLPQDVRLLNEVQVTGVASLIEEKVDRLVYNAEKDFTSKGGDAADVMRKVPMLSVDLDGNVSLRGSSNVRVLINNKPSTIVASSVADALKQIPADMIKTVEVITSPSAKYDAEGSAGIINIVTKKNTLQGLTLNVESSVGNRGSNLNLNGNYRRGNMGMSLGGFGRANYNIIGKLESVQTAKLASGGSFITNQNSDSRNAGSFGNYNLGWDWDISKTSSVTASVRYGARNQLTVQDLATRLNNNGVPLRSSLRHVDSKDLSGTWDVNVDYTKQLGKPQQEFSISTQFSRNNRNNNFLANLLDITNNSITSRERNDNLSYNQETTVQLDYQTPIGQRQLIEFGGKGIMRQISSDYQYLMAVGENGAFMINPNRPANVFDYNQNVVGSYVSYTLSTKSKYSIKAGARYEYTTINANFRTDKQVTIPDYGNLVPSINISKNLRGNLTLKAAYNRRLQRPSIQFLNPNLNAANPQSITFGNPNLAPELTDNYELSVSKYLKTTYLNLTAFVRHTGNAIEAVRTTDDLGVISTTYQNIGQQDAYGLNLFGNVTIARIWQLGGGIDGFYAVLNGFANGQQLSNSGIVTNYRFFSNVTLGKGWGLQGFGFMRSGQVQLQGSQGGFGVYSLGVKRDFKNKKGSVGFGIENFFSESFKVRNTLDNPNFTQNSTQFLFNRGVKVTFSYRIGKMSFEDTGRKKKKSVSNDDQKSEGGGTDQGTGSRPAAGGPR